MAYDSTRGRMIMFGGTLDNNDRGYTWSWDGDHWEVVATSGPSHRYDPAMVYDAGRDRVVMFGGRTSAFPPTDVYSSQTWEWDGSTWSLRATTGPSDRSGHTMAYDAARGRTVLFGGRDSTSAGANETWEWDGTSWTLRTTTGPSPQAEPAMAYDPARARVVLSIVTDPNNYLGETWEWDGDNWALRSGGSLIEACYGSCMAYDSDLQRVVRFGGIYYDAFDFDPDVIIYVNSTYVWDGNNWTSLSTSGRLPSARAGSAMAYDSARGRMVLTGGYDPYASCETWELEGNTWTNSVAGHLLQESGGPIVYDIARDRILQLGDGTWRWDDSNGWVHWTSTSPSASSGHAMAYDAVRSRTVLFGGWVYNNSLDDFQPTGETWEENGSGWTQRATTGPIARTNSAMAYDSTRGVVVLFGGARYSTRYADTWEWDGTTWLQRATTGPSPRSYAAMAYDAARGRTVLFGGNDGSDKGDTWEWDGSSWSLITSTGPSPRKYHYMTYDAVSNRVVLFGGNDGVANGDTWEWDGTSWTQTSNTGPNPRDHAGMAYDSHRNRVILIGGTGNSNGEIWAYQRDASLDCNQNGTLDACEGTAGAAYSGDMDGSGVVDLLDVPGFVSTLLTGTSDCVHGQVNVADVNADGSADGGDIELFAAALLGS